MLDKALRLIDQLTRQAAYLDRQQWIVLSVLVLLVGLACMRGFGSRSNF
jgi:hypothetical protein